MLVNEARWVGQVLSYLDGGAISPVLNVGSATAMFREQVQPWIDKDVLAPLRNKGVLIEHLDVQEGDGVDLHGDLTDDAFVSTLSTRGYRAILCCNVLEHVAEPIIISAKLESLLPPGGYILVTVPNRFPYHPDPIDTMFRPGVDDVVALFPRCRLLRGEVIDCGTGWDYVERTPRVMLSKLKRRVSGLSRHGGMKGSASFLPWLFRRFRQTCILLQRFD